MSSQLPDTPDITIEEVGQTFERGLRWTLSVESRFLGFDSRLMILAGLHLIDPARVQEVRRALSQVGGADPLNVLFAVLERDPLPLRWDEPDLFDQFTPSSLPQRPEDRLRMNYAMAQGALAQAAQGRLEGPFLSWMRQDLWGYDLNHQLLAWILALKCGHRTVEARERILRIGARIWHEVEHSHFPIYYDLLAESSVFLALSGFSLTRLGTKFHTILRAQAGDGGWWFTFDPSQFQWLLDHAHLDASSPLLGPLNRYSEASNPSLARQRLEVTYRGHSTGLSLWGLGILLHRQRGQLT